MNMTGETRPRRILTAPICQDTCSGGLGVVFYFLREPLFSRGTGWAVGWAMLVFIGIFGTFGPTPGSVEGVVYTVIPIAIQLTLSPEILVQSFLLSSIAFYWIRSPKKIWLSWVMGFGFVVTMAIPILALLAGG